MEPQGRGSCAQDGPRRVGDEPDGPLWLVINLDRSPDRLAAVGAALGALGIPFTRVPAVDGRALRLPMPGIDPDLYRASHGRDVLPGEVGCALSHLRALRTFLATPHRHAVILEDDAVVPREAIDVVAALVGPKAPDDWDLVKLEAHHSRFGFTVRRVAPGIRLCSLPCRAAGSAAYLVNRAAAEALLAGILPMRFPYDIAFERGWAFGLRVRTVLPLPVTTAPVPPVLARAAGAGQRRRAPVLKRICTKAAFAVTASSAWLAAKVSFTRRHDSAWRSAPFDLAERALARCGPESAGEGRRSGVSREPGRADA